ncbi:tyrosine-type recombinase/integrase [Halonatronum saccharophilum]|uniref:tyrosine-type recombinase/integrase n=1 Tax=Halonatronum saccharophilum TaxID=150060 RepID=UPI0004B45B60|nr:tyrosine-type recombinase/integrase [Halonatronum saccharophilum]
MEEMKVRKNQIIELSIKDLVDKFIAAQDVAKSSRQIYQRELRQFINWLESTDRIETLNSLAREDILQYKRDLIKSQMSSYTISSYITVVRKFFQWLESEKIYPNITQNIKGMKKPKGHKKNCLTVDQIREALNSINREDLNGKRNYAIFNLLVRTGLRTVEVARVNVGDIRQKSDQAVLYIQGKGRDQKDDFVILTKEALKPIRDYLAARGDIIGEQEPLFISHSNRNYGKGLTTRSIRRVIKGILKEIGLNTTRYSAHSLRHTAITLAIKGGASLQQTQAMARHSDPKTTMIYYHNLNRVEEGAEKKIKI